jgi:hypothetical protein
LHVTPGFVTVVAQNPETKALLQLTTDVGLIVAPNPNKMVKLINMSNIVKLTVLSAKGPRCNYIVMGILGPNYQTKNTETEHV